MRFRGVYGNHVIAGWLWVFLAESLLLRILDCSAVLLVSDGPCGHHRTAHFELLFGDLVLVYECVLLARTAFQ